MSAAVRPVTSSRRRLRIASALRLAKILPVADTLDDQRDRDVVHDQLEKLLGVFKLVRQRAAFG